MEYIGHYCTINLYLCLLIISNIQIGAYIQDFRVSAKRVSAMNEQNDNGNIILYQTEDGKSRIEVTLCNDTVWLTADQMAELFQRNKSTISRHIKNVFEDGELNPDSTVAFFATVQNEGDRTVERNLAYYNLDMIISVGYRVKSHRGVQFRIWATQILRDYLVKGER